MRLRRQEDRRRELRDQTVPQVEFNVETGQVALLLRLDFVDRNLRIDLAARFLLDMRQGQKSFGQQLVLADPSRRHGGQVVPADAIGQANPRPVLHRLAPGRHRRALQRVVAQITAPLQQRACGRNREERVMFPPTKDKVSRLSWAAALPHGTIRAGPGYICRRISP